MKYPNGAVYMILTDAQVTVTVLNLSTSTHKDKMPKKIEGGVTKYLTEFAEPVPSQVLDRTWLNFNQAKVAWAAIDED